ncbi:hypothetical protein KAR91_42825 [Candidatus Pacearchaeota archaeon]|nr:hypothetical protein [Candidatus Pacearchaeota archaeon]
MEKEIEILRGKLGSYDLVAKELGITARHLLNVKKGEHISRSLELLIKRLSKDIKP